MAQGRLVEQLQLAPKAKADKQPTSDGLQPKSNATPKYTLKESQA